MSEKRPQTYANHAKLVPLFHYVAMPLLLINLILGLVGLLEGLTLESLNRIGTGVAMVLAALFARVFALKAQDRVIRLEERLRMERLLPDDLKPRIDEVSTAQCVALRFAGDDELPALVRRGLDEKADQKTIKQAIKEWRPDYQRV
ncbi:MAG: DUF6526 family protein [Acidobacteria bacterium]|nr:DUF6526 family protein [Acidobacteriota bacterium]